MLFWRALPRQGRNRYEGVMFRFFETLIDPYQPYDEQAEFPDRLIPFYLRFLHPARWVIATSMLLSLIFALTEAALARFAGQLVDLLSVADPATVSEDLARPGHIFPLSAVPGGVLRRAGHTEAAVDLARLADLRPVGMLCEIIGRLFRSKKPPFVTRYSVWLMGRNVFFSVDKARNQLNWQSKVSYDQGIKNTAQWYLKQL